MHVIATTDAGDCGDVDNTASVTDRRTTASDSDSATVDVNCARHRRRQDRRRGDASTPASRSASPSRSSNTGAGEATRPPVHGRPPGRPDVDDLARPRPAGRSRAATWSTRRRRWRPARPPRSTSSRRRTRRTAARSTTPRRSTTSNDGLGLRRRVGWTSTAPAIDVEKVADDDSVSAGDQIGFTVTLKNTGEGEAKGIQFTDALPAGLSWSICPGLGRLVDRGAATWSTRRRPSPPAPRPRST